MKERKRERERVPFLDYYKERNIIPVVDLKDTNEKKLFQQRFNFYFKIGLTPSDFLNKSVLELCAGTGYNAYYLLKHCKIKKISVVDNNPESLKVIKKNLIKFNNKLIINKNIYYFKSKKKYDYVILENALPGLAKQKKILEKIFSLTKPGGCIILTLSSLEGVFSEKLRYFYSVLLTQQNNVIDFDKKIKFLSKIFHKHLKYLSPNTKKTKKWVLDNILNEDWIKKKKYFDLLDLFKLLKKKFYIKSTSPLFSKDFIWYKNTNQKKYNENIKKNYLYERINYIDFETQFSKNFKKIKYVKQIIIYIRQFSFQISKIKSNKKISIRQIENIYNIILKISKIIKHFEKKNNKISISLNEFLTFILKFKNKKLNTKTKYFYKFWGIGTNAITLYKNL